MNKLSNLINKQRGLLVRKQHEFEKKFGINCTANYFIDGFLLKHNYDYR